MQYLWQHKLQVHQGMKTVDGLPLQVINPGRLNTDSGPDFFNAKINLDGQPWVGNIEIHVKASDWYHHHHDNDPAYDSVILHVVGLNDRRVNIARQQDRVLPQVELPCPPHFEARYASLVSSSRTHLPCAGVIKALSSLQVADILGTLGLERLQEKVDRVKSLLEHYSGDWEEVAYVILARALGFSVNSDPFERLARATPLRYIRKHSDDPALIEALLLGQAGLLDSSIEGNRYLDSLRQEYRFLQNKFSLTPPGIQWKTARMRPANMPHRRIALLARILTSTGSLMSHIISIKNLDEATSLFNRELTGYWRSAYAFADNSPAGSVPPVALSRSSIISLIINVVAPLTYAWGEARCDDRALERAVTLLEELPPEHNRLTTFIESAGITLRNALDSQAAIQLRRAYCESSKCLYCKVGYRVMKGTATENQTTTV